jgi:repressor LexA
MSKTLSRRQEDILHFIQRHTEVKGYPPTVREIGEAVNLRSSSTVHGHLKALQSGGHIMREAARTRAIRMPNHSPTVQVPLIGRVAAGQPILAEENVEDTFRLPVDLAGGEDSFMLRVKGDSMIEDGIIDGDLVIVRPQHTAQDGDRVVALMEDEATVKRFYRENNRVRLQPANSTLEPIYTDDVTILGRVVGLIRTLS